jgi:hypothetical protein
MILLEVEGAGGQFHSDYFLVDSGGERTVLSFALCQSLGLPGVPAPGARIIGISGVAPVVLVTSQLRFTAVDGQTVPVNGPFAAFVDPLASPHSILGRDLLDSFDLILSRRRNDVLLLSGVHSYQVLAP